MWKTALEPPTESIDQCREVTAFRAWFDEVACRHGGEYDGWAAAAKR